MIESSDDLIWSVDLEFRLITFNSAFRRNFLDNYGIEAAAGKCPKELLPAERAALWPPLYRQALTEGAYRTEYSLVDGRTLELTFNSITMEGAATGVSVFGRDITQRKASEELLRQLAAIVESSDDGIATYALDGTILTWNHSAEVIYGYSAEEAIGGNLFMVVPEERRAAVTAYNQQVRQGNSIPLREEFGLRKDGKRIRISVTTSPLRNAEREVTSISIIVRDVTARREAEEAQALLASIVECCVDVVHAIGLEGSITSWNRGAEALYGYSSREVLGKSIAMLAMAENMESLAKVLESIRAGHAIENRDTVVRHKDGHALDVAVSISPMRDAEGKLIGASAILQDIRQRKHAERALAESEERYRATFEHAGVGIAHTGLDGHYLRCNRRFAEIVGYSQEEIAEMSYQQITLKEDMEESQRQLKRLLDEEAIFSMWEKRYLRKDGTVTWVKLTVSAQRDAEGRPLHWITVVEDINALKAAQEEIRKLAFHDPLTGLANRRLFAARLEHSLALNRRSGNKTALLFIDIDNFKILNDMFGHSTGDMLLCEVAQKLLATVREADMVARLGGDEFMVIVEELSGTEEIAREQARIVAEKILAAVTSPCQCNGHRCQCTVSIGGAIISDPMAHIDQAMQQADHAMYEAKAAGRNTIRFFTQGRAKR